jgi:hypothetical protein
LPEEGALGPAVALAERVHGIDLAQVAGHPGEEVDPSEEVDPVDEVDPCEAPQKVLIAQLLADLGGGRLDELRAAEHAPLGDGHRADLPGPVVDVAEGLAVDLDSPS